MIQQDPLCPLNAYSLYYILYLSTFFMMPFMTKMHISLAVAFCDMLNHKTDYLDHILCQN